MTFDECFSDLDILIRSMVNHYTDLLGYLDYDDLMQEGRLIAFVAFNQWMKQNKKDRTLASLTSWVYVHVQCRFRELRTKKPEEAAFSECCEDGEENAGEYGALVSKVSKKKMLKDTFESALQAKDTAQCITRTPQRVGQLHQEFVKAWDEIELKGEKKDDKNDNGEKGERENHTNRGAVTVGGDGERKKRKSGLVQYARHIRNNRSRQTCGQMRPCFA